MSVETIGRVSELVVSAAFAYSALHPRTRLRGAMPGGRTIGPPISRAGRVIILLLAAVIAVDGVRGLLHKPPLEFDIVHWRLVS